MLKKQTDTRTRVVLPSLQLALYICTKTDFYLSSLYTSTQILQSTAICYIHMHLVYTLPLFAIYNRCHNCSCINIENVFSCFLLGGLIRKEYLQGTDILTYLPTYLLTYSMHQSPSWEAIRFSASQEIPRILWNPKIHYRSHKCPAPVRILIQVNPVHALRFPHRTVC